MHLSCQQLKQQLEDIKSLKKEFDLELRKTIATRNMNSKEFKEIFKRI